MTNVALLPQREMAVVNALDALQTAVADARARGLSIGVVPTMGALHAGHYSLIETARAECGFAVVTLFVNPTQFGPNEDFTRYPRPVEQDLAGCKKRNVDLVYVPSSESMYPDGSATFVEVERLSTVFEGAHRPGHFRGVATVVTKLFNRVRPDIAYFGRKDYQQQILIRRMCRDLDIPVEIRTCPTVREADGLALSSRNQYLSPDDRKKALELSGSLRLAKARLEAGETDVHCIRQAMWNHLAAIPNVSVDYATVAHPETLEELTRPLRVMVALVAARVGNTRLIDNLLITLHNISD